MRFFKKLFKFLKWIITGAVWTYIYLSGTLILFRSVWGFNYLSQKSWQILSSYWNSGGSISTGKDYLLVLCLIVLIPLWIWGWKKLYKANYVALLLAPLLWYQKREADNSLKAMSRTKIHNIGISIGDDIKQDFENKLQKRQAAATNAPKASQNIRLQLKDKLRHE
jgi:hypothetical protein